MTKLRVYENTKSLFYLPDGVIYLDGNSLGALPLGVAERVNRVITAEWGDELIRLEQCGLVRAAAPGRRPHCAVDRRRSRLGDDRRYTVAEGLSGARCCD